MKKTRMSYFEEEDILLMVVAATGASYDNRLECASFAWRTTKAFDSTV